MGGMVWFAWPPGSEPLQLLATIPVNGAGQGCCLQLEAQRSERSVLGGEERLEA